METKLYIGNLSSSTTEEELRKLFSQAGTVNLVWIGKDPVSHRSWGFAFIAMSNQADALTAAEMFNGFNLADHNLRVRLARPLEQDRTMPSDGRAHSRRAPRRGSNKPE